MSVYLYLHVCIIGIFFKGNKKKLIYIAALHYNLINNLFALPIKTMHKIKNIQKWNNKITNLQLIKNQLFKIIMQMRCSMAVMNAIISTYNTHCMFIMYINDLTLYKPFWCWHEFGNPYRKILEYFLSSTTGLFMYGLTLLVYGFMMVSISLVIWECTSIGQFSNHLNKWEKKQRKNK